MTDGKDFSADDDYGAQLDAFDAMDDADATRLHLEVEEAMEDENSDLKGDESTAGATTPRPVYSFTHPVMFYEKIIANLVPEEPAHFLAVSRTGYPGAVYYAARKELDVVSFVCGVGDHAYNHGQEHLEDLLLGHHWCAAKARVMKDLGQEEMKKRARTNTFACVVLNAPRKEDQLVPIMEAPV